MLSHQTSNGPGAWVWSHRMGHGAATTTTIQARTAPPRSIPSLPPVLAYTHRPRGTGRGKQAPYGAERVLSDTHHHPSRPTTTTTNLFLLLTHLHISRDAAHAGRVLSLPCPAALLP